MQKLAIVSIIVMLVLSQVGMLLIFLHPFNDNTPGSANAVNTPNPASSANSPTPPNTAGTAGSLLSSPPTQQSGGGGDDGGGGDS